MLKIPNICNNQFLNQIEVDRMRIKTRKLENFLLFTEVVQDIENN